MKSYLLGLGVSVFGLVLVLNACTSTKNEVEGDFFYARTSAGVLCGYSVLDTTLVVVDGKQVILLEQTGFTMGSLLGMDYDQTTEMQFHIDPTVF